MTPSKKHSFSTTILTNGTGGAYVELPFDVEAAFGSKRPKIKATFDGEAYRGVASRMGAPEHIIVVLKAIREKIGKQPGDTVKVTVEADTEPRVIKPPKDFVAALKGEAEAWKFWKQLSYTHHREYVRWIEEAKKPETRERRIAKAVKMLQDKIRSR